MSDDWKPNTLGRCPEHLKGTAKRVYVRLRGDAGRPIEPKESWPADTSRHHNTNWTLDGSKWQITHWKEAK